MKRFHPLVYAAPSLTSLAFALSTFAGSASAAASTVTFGNNDNNETYAVKVGQTINLSLNARYRIPYGHKGSTIKPRGTAKTYDPWIHFSTTSSSVVSLQGDYKITSHAGPVKGTKRLNSLQVYKANKPGTATLKALSDYYWTCGPKVACPYNHVLVRYQVTIKVEPAN